MVFHGGFWKAQYGRKLMHPLCRDLAARGWAAWNLEYRRLGRLSGGGWPTTFEDMSAGIDHLHEVQAPLDLTRVVTIGHSAGGHLAALAATRPWPRVQVTGVVSQAGVLDLRARVGVAALERRRAAAAARHARASSPSATPRRRPPRGSRSACRCC